MDKKCLCKIYRSKKKPGAYLYMRFRDEVDELPNELIVALGELTEVMSLALESSRKLANADVLKVINDLESVGYYLQMPPVDLSRPLLSSEIEERLRGGSLNG